jgi:tetratricopeptide (TPR) repeat protein
MAKLKIKSKEISQVEDLIVKGDYKKAAQLVEQIPDTTELRTAAIKAHILIYQGRLDEAAEVLEPFEDQIHDETNLKDTAEFGMSKADLLYWRGEYEAAERQLQNVLGIYRIKGDLFGQARALSLIGRVYRRQGNYELARKHLDEALQAAHAQTEIEETDFLVGNILFNLGVIHHQLGELDRAESLYTKAMRLLKQTENGRSYAFVLNSYGMLLRARGKYEPAARYYRESINYFSESASFNDLAHAINNLAYVQIRLGDTEAAAKLLTESLELRRRAKDMAGESVTLELMGVLHLEQGQLDEARHALNSAIQLAELANDDQEKAFALITLGRVLITQEVLDEGKEKLTEALRLAIQLKSKMLECESCTYLAEVQARKGDGVGAYESLQRAKSLMNGYTDAYLKTQIERVENLLREEKIKTAGGAFIIKSSFLPTWREAHDSLGKFLLTEALQHSGGSQVRASELLGVTKAYITMLRRKYGV